MTFADIAKIQKALNDRGFGPLKVDGIFGKLTSLAVRAFKRSQGLRDRDYVGPITKAALFEQKKPAAGIVKGDPVWMRLARQEIGVREIEGPKHSARVLWYWAKSKLGFTSDETPWCAGFVGAMLENVGIRSTRSGMARSYLNWGRPIKHPVNGAVVVFWRGSRSGTSGHVGFIAGVDQRGRLLVLGGNQGDAVNIKPFDRSRVLGYRWPTAVPIDDNLTAKVSFDLSSSNEG